jgi:hypothetical protein
VIVGTALYMAPEQAAGHKQLTTAADVYSLGAILYEMLTGRPPFQGETIMETLLQVKEREPVRPRTLNPRLDRDLETVCLKCLQKEPQKRYGSAESLAEDLDRWVAGEPIQARATGRVERLWRWSRRNPVVASLSVAVLLVTLGGFFGVLDRWQVALANEQKADEQRDEAQKQRDEVRALNEKLQRTLYAAHMNLAHNAWEAGGAERVRELLELHRPKAAEIDRRGFEWHYLYRLCHAELFTLKGHKGSDGVCSVAYSPDGKRLASATGEGVKVWDAQTGQELLTFKGGGYRVAFSPDSKRLASSGEQEVKVWDVRTGQELLTLKRGGPSVAFSPDGKRLASPAWDRTTQEGWVRVWDAQTGQELLTLQKYPTAVYSAVFRPDGKRLAGASWLDGDPVLKVWDGQTGQESSPSRGTRRKSTTWSIARMVHAWPALQKTAR